MVGITGRKVSYHILPPTLMISVEPLIPIDGDDKTDTSVEFQRLVHACVS